MGRQMRRRDFITLLVGSASAWPFGARGQKSSTPVIGFLGGDSAPDFAPQLEGFRKGLGEAGYSENQNVAIEYRWADSQYDRLPALATDLAHRGVDVILASGPPAAIAAKAATATIPVIFVVGFDPVAAKLVASLNSPGGNLTGMYLYIGGLVAKKIELLREMAPDLGNFAVAVNAGTPSAKLDSAEADAARASGKPVSIVNVGNDAEIDALFANLGGHMAGIAIGTDTFFFAKRVHLAAAAARPACPPVLAGTRTRHCRRFQVRTRDQYQRR